MGSGCLRPPQTTGQINLSVLDTIYDDVKDIERAIDHSQYANLKIYQEIRQRIWKTGQLKKLCDYLSSHRSRICQTMLHCYRITNQSKIYIYKYVAIIVMDAILNSTPKNRVSIERFSMSAHSSYHEQINKKQDNNQKQIGLISKQQNSQIQKGTISKNQTALIQEITSQKFEGIYFNFIATLLKQGGLLYKLTLDNLIRFSELSESFFSSETQVLEIVKTIRHHIQTNDSLYISLKAYYAALPRIRETYFAQNTDILKVIFNLWNPKPSQLFSLNALQPQKQLLMSELCRKIIQIFIKKCVQSYQYDPIIQAFFDFFDENCFRNIAKGFNLMFEVISQLQLKNQFNKSLIRCLMAYVGFPESKQKGITLRTHSRSQDVGAVDQQGESTNILQKKWTQIFKMGNAQNFRQKFKNIRNRDCKLNSIPVIYVWVIQQHLVEMSQLLTYSGLNLIYSYLLNMASNQQTVQQKANQELVRFVAKMEIVYKTKILQLIMSQIEQSPLFDDVSFMMLTICQKIVNGMKGFYIPSKNSHIIQPITSNSFENNKKLLQLLGRVLSKLDKQCIIDNLQKICEMYKSLIFEISNGLSSSDQKVQLLQEINNKFCDLPNYYRGINVAFLQLIQSQIVKQSGQGSKNCLLFLDYLFVKISKICNLGVRNQNLQNYLQILSHKRDLQKIQLLQQYAKDRFSMHIDLPINQRKKLKFYNQCAILFKKKHKESNLQIQTNGEYSSNMGESVNTKRDSVCTVKGDQDFEDALGIIKVV